jgi:hypothetical protein
MWHNHFGSACTTRVGHLCEVGCGAPTGCAGFGILESCAGEAGLFVCIHKELLAPVARTTSKPKPGKTARPSRAADAKRKKKVAKKVAKKKTLSRAGKRHGKKKR